MVSKCVMPVIHVLIRNFNYSKILRPPFLLLVDAVPRLQAYTGAVPNSFRLIFVPVTAGSAFAATHPESPDPSSLPRSRKRTSTIRWHQRDQDRSLATKQRIIRMLFVVVVEFFVCWTPLYVLNTVSLFHPEAVYYGLGYRGICFLQLLAYASSCCNPITYCFMNRTFRVSFLCLFRDRHCCRSSRSNLSLVRGSTRKTFVNAVSQDVNMVASTLPMEHLATVKLEGTFS